MPGWIEGANTTFFINKTDIPSNRTKTSLMCTLCMTPKKESQNQTKLWHAYGTPLYSQTIPHQCHIDMKGLIYDNGYQKKLPQHPS